MKEQKERHYVICECGAKVYGNYSKISAEKNLPAHKISKKHKELIDLLLAFYLPPLPQLNRVT